MATRFTLSDSLNNTVDFTYTEATDTGMVLAEYLAEIGQEKSAGGQIKQQIRPGLRYAKAHQMCLTEAKYISFYNLITSNANDYYITYTTAPTILSNNSEISTTNAFKIAFQVEAVTTTASSDGTTIYKFNITIMSTELF